MKNTILILFLSLVFSCQSEKSKAEDKLANYTDYELTIIEFRKQIIDFFENSEDSPTFDLDKKEKKSPKFFSPNEDYKVNALLNVYKEQDTVEIATTKSDDIRKMIKYGEFSFKINGESFKLNAYLNIKNPSRFFVPFTDETNGISSYTGGRYIDIDKLPGKRYILDFNFAYAPYCYYNEKYSCPLVPLENHLETEIKAGEMTDEN